MIFHINVKYLYIARSFRQNSPGLHIVVRITSPAIFHRLFYFGSDVF